VSIDDLKSGIRGPTPAGAGTITINMPASTAVDLLRAMFPAESVAALIGWPHPPTE
jgi:hypothetical protein